ncbi:response regulator receiver protein [[Leptolyngbya] sp. PCC 7376]|uniref:response regulator n=1 Tax=[Leptolyngbya] sp. PCC 7376 TaxID=111781 RepID=UPI00029F1685|nr:response regulator [[Leptolyngbya] sp. PCC 7376]AFY38797.1 response regulator receiver protein [[Leptolyngbya] sp. PCC 7376]
MSTILIVEDDPINIRVFTKILKKRGKFEVICSEDVDYILTVAGEGKVDAIVMDVSLTDSTYEGESVDGIRITQLLKADPVTQKIPVVLVTAHAMQGDRESFLAKSGADGYISKPVVDHQAFVDQMKSLIV